MSTSLSYYFSLIRNKVVDNDNVGSALPGKWCKVLTFGSLSRHTMDAAESALEINKRIGLTECSETFIKQKCSATNN